MFAENGKVCVHECVCCRKETCVEKKVRPGRVCRVYCRREKVYTARVFCNREKHGRTRVAENSVKNCVCAREWFAKQKERERGKRAGVCCSKKKMSVCEKSVCEKSVCVSPGVSVARTTSVCVCVCVRGCVAEKKCARALCTRLVLEETKYPTAHVLEKKKVPHMCWRKKNHLCHRKKVCPRECVAQGKNKAAVLQKNKTRACVVLQKSVCASEYVEETNSGECVAEKTSTRVCCLAEEICPQVCVLQEKKMRARALVLLVLQKNVCARVCCRQGCTRVCCGKKNARHAPVCCGKEKCVCARVFIAEKKNACAYVPGKKHVYARTSHLSCRKNRARLYCRKM